MHKSCCSLTNRTGNIQPFLSVLAIREKALKRGFIVRVLCPDTNRGLSCDVSERRGVCRDGSWRVSGEEAGEAAAGGGEAG